MGWCDTMIKPLFIILVAIGTALTAIAMFTPGWRLFENGPEIGIITRNCDGISNNAECGDWWDDQPDWAKAVIVLVIIAFVIEIIVLIWSVMSLMAFYTPSMFYPLPILTGLAAALLIAAIAVYSAEENQTISAGEAPPSSINSESSVGYSFWIAVAAMVVMVVATFFGCIVAAISGNTPS
ncbi:tight junction protein, claudin-like domain-containing protein [Ditylenchus destructor]|uniref:Tight junction protein, claudin-like domain-containing protein n=1 Tax=Ditylenchus destructor TaxID=166010 RepID=A0AAD4NKN8_9BILA|nr:tight junction protein, claudin-like domain-containing protein [Ditylenchus destructor]